MTDMDALFASRKKKKGKKKPAARNFNEVLENTANDGVVTMLREERDENGYRVIVEDVVSGESGAAPKVGGLTAAVRASKGLAPESEVAKSSEYVPGDWDDDKGSSAAAPRKVLAAGVVKKSVADLSGLPSQQAVSNKTEQMLEEEEQNMKRFHWTRKQALQETEDTPQPKETTNEEKPKFFRPRAMLEARVGAESAAALKELDNEMVFPSLGGPGTAKPKTKSVIPQNSAWGVVREEVIADLEIKQPDGEYLGEDFFEAEEFGGFKSGYSFKMGRRGLGYYWEGKPQPKSETQLAAEAAEAEAQKLAAAASAAPEAVGNAGQQVAAAASAPAQAPENPPAVRKAPGAYRPPHERGETVAVPSAPAPSTQQPPQQQQQQQEPTISDEERERRRREKKEKKAREKAEWERQQRELVEKEERERAEALAAKAAKEKEEAEAAKAEAAAAAVEPPPEERFAGLKKKKKKKATAAE